jgi:hypothetical protein
MTVDAHDEALGPTLNSRASQSSGDARDIVDNHL